MPKRRSGGRGGRRAAAKRRQRHLYLVFDDWLWGYSIRKVDLSPDSDSSDDDTPHQTAPAVPGEAAIDRTEQRLPPAIVRMEAPHGLSYYFAAAFGTKILSRHPGMPGVNLHPLVPTSVAPVFDVRTRGLTFGPRPTSYQEDPIYIPIGDMLFAMAVGSFQLLHPPPPPGESAVWSWCKLQKPPFKRRNITSYTVHPDGQTIFVSVKKRSGSATFTFDIESFQWKQHSDWIMPFTDSAHFDRELDAMVGLSGDPNTEGYLCACCVPPVVDGQCECPSWKLSKEKLFSEEASETHIGATLVYMGGGRSSKFCLAQCVSVVEEQRVADSKNYYEPEPDSDEEDVPLVPCRYLLRLTTFSLKYDRNGDLTTGDSRRVQYYKVNAASELFM